MSKRSLLVLASALVLLGSTGTVTAQVRGFVDLHSHLEGEYAFGGGWFWGTNTGPIDWALQRCDGNFPHATHAALKWPIVSELVGGHGLFGGDTGLHLGRRRGYDRRQCRYVWPFPWPIPGTCPRPHFEHWPMWDAIAHQQMWEGHLQQAHNGGLQVMFVSLVESSFLCGQTKLRTRRFGCDEMASVYRQAGAVHSFAARNSSWVGIATTPAEARALIAQGKLALVLSVEVDKLFPDGDVITQVDALRAQGVRSLQIVHHADSRFAGAAPISELIRAANLAESLEGGDITQINNIVCRDAAGSRGTCNGDTVLNERGLSQEGDALVRAMMDRGMLVDVAHVSRKALRDVYGIAMQRGPYPLLYSHAHIWDTIDPGEKRHEKYIRADEIHMITDTGGMVGLRTGPEDTVQYGGAVANQCQGSTRSFAQSLMYGIDHGLTMGFGADLNGFIDQIEPRWRPIDCRADFVAINQAGGPTEIQKKGLAHVGLLPELLTDLSRVGVPDAYIEHLNQSAENFLLMWERAVSLGGGASSNLARSATASASSTYCVPMVDCYSPARVNDGSNATTLGQYWSWANANHAAMPQWVELTWPSPITATRVELYTTTSYPIRDYQVEYWTGSGWAPLAFMSFNTSDHLTHTFAPVPTTRLRVLGLRGPDIQPGYVRVNEIEVY